MSEFSFSELPSADLVVDATYVGGTGGNIGDDPISRLLPVGNAGGIRTAGKSGPPRALVLVTSGEHLDWPDEFDPEAGVLTYFGDNRQGGRGLHDTPRRGNAHLRDVFATAASAEGRPRIPPIFGFAKSGKGRAYRFLGLFVPGDWRGTSDDGLVAIWRTVSGVRFQNYRARFTALDIATIPRSWADSIVRGGPPVDFPGSGPLKRWKAGGAVEPLLAPRTRRMRSRLEQLPDSARDIKLLATIRAHFAPKPHLFEGFAIEIARLFLSSVDTLEGTRPSRDGGRDGIGTFRLGSGDGSIVIDFALEAKCYAASNGVGVRELSRLISRIRHRQFGVLVATSYLDQQAYSELKEDGHPIVVITARDIARVLNEHDYPRPPQFRDWLERRYPTT